MLNSDAPPALPGPPWPPLALPCPSLGPPGPPWPLLAPLPPPAPPSRAKKREKSTPFTFLPGAPWPPLAAPRPPSVLSGLPLSTKLAVELLYWWELRATALNPKRQWFGWWPVKAHSGREKKPSTNENCWTAFA